MMIQERYPIIEARVSSVQSTEEGKFTLHRLTTDEALDLIAINAPGWTSIALTALNSRGAIRVQQTVYNVGE